MASSVLPKVEKQNLCEDNREYKLAGTLQPLPLSLFPMNGTHRCSNRYGGKMGRGEATECYLIPLEARKSTNNNRRRLALVLSYFRNLTFTFADCMQAFHRGRRDTKVSVPNCAPRQTQCDDAFYLPLRSGSLWQCPNGDSCQYRHALTPAPVPKSQKKAPEEAERATTISLEEFSEVEVRSSCVCVRP